MRIAVGFACVLAACGGGKSTADDDQPADGETDDADDGTVPPPPEAVCEGPMGAVDTTTPAHVVTACADDAALRAAVAEGGIITFACGGPAVITVTQTLELRTDVDTVIDGGNQVTLDGGGTTRILSFDHQDYRVNPTRLVLQHLTLAHGKAVGTKPFAEADPPCSQGFYDGYGGALNLRDGVLLVVDVLFQGNDAAALGPDVGGGAIALLGSKQATVIDSRFVMNSGSNGGAISALNSELDVYNSTFRDNFAKGHGANGDDASMCDVIADTGQHQVGSGGNGGAIAIDGGDDLTHTFCGVTFQDNHGGDEALGGALFRTPDRAKQTTVIDRSGFVTNTGYSAGATYFHNSDLQILATTFSQNVASHGSGAIQADGTTFAITNSTFEANHAMAGLGGAISLFGGGGAITFTTFANNLADGGDPYFGAAIGGNPTLSLASDLFVNNTAQNPGAPMQCHVTGTGDGDLQWPMNHVVGNGGDAKCTPTTTFADPLLDPLADNGGPTYTLLPAATGPAHGAGVGCPATDQRGMPRPATGCTSGSVEP